MYKILASTLTLIFLASPALACEVKTDAAYKDKAHDNYVIPVSVKPNEKCVIIDFNSDGGRDVRKRLWQRRDIEQYGPISKNLYGKFYHDYKASGDNISVDRYIYKARAQTGTEEIIFSGASSSHKDRIIAYMIHVE